MNNAIAEARDMEDRTLRGYEDDEYALGIKTCACGDFPMCPTCRERQSIRLLRDQVLVRLIPVERKEGRFFIPDNAKRRDDELYRGVVIATGPGWRSPKYGTLFPCDVKPGDVCVFYWLGDFMTKTQWPDENHLILPESQIKYVETP